MKHLTYWLLMAIFCYIVASCSAAKAQDYPGFTKTKQFNHLVKTRLDVKAYSYINENGDLKYVKCDTIMVTQTASRTAKLVKDKKGLEFWYFNILSSDTYWGDYRYYLSGKEIFPLEIFKQENIFSDWHFYKKIE